MDAYELTHLLPKPEGFLARRRRVAAEAEARARVVEARLRVHSLPLGVAPTPSVDRVRLRAADAPGALDRALRRTAVAFRVCVEPDDGVAVLARRLARARAVDPALAEAVALLAPTLGVRGCDEGARLVERMVGYLDHRTEVGPGLLARFR